MAHAEKLWKLNKTRPPMLSTPQHLLSKLSQHVLTPGFPSKTKLLFHAMLPYQDTSISNQCSHSENDFTIFGEIIVSILS